MKRIISMSLALVLLASCGGNDSKTKEDGNDLSQNPDYKKGLALVSKNDCFQCHRIDEAFTGPAYREVAEKYAGSDTALNYLADKIIHGGSGVWGQVPMIPHPNLTEDDAKTIAKYILLLKK